MALTSAETVKERLSLAEVVRQRVKLTPAGRYLKGLCPFHSEKTPSFFVFPDSNTFKCFGCSEGGDVFTFVMKTENLDFREALRRLAQQAGVPLSAGSGAESGELKAIMRANDDAADYFHQALLHDPVGEKARAYVAKRGLDRPTLEKFRIGYAPEGWDNLTRRLQALDFADSLLVAAGLSRQGDRGPYDVFRERLMFPIANRRGEVVGFGGRALGDDPAKYMNTPRTAVFDKGSMMYGFHLARDAIRASGRAVIVEGYMDAIAAHQHGFANVVASMGTSITPSQVKSLTGLAGRLIICLDADAAGVAATRRSLEMILHETAESVESGAAIRNLLRIEAWMKTQVFIAELPEGMDPDDVIRNNVGAWRAALDQAKSLPEYLFKSVSREIDPRSPQGQSAAIEQLVPIIREIPDALARSSYVGRLATLLRMPADSLQKAVDRRRPVLRARAHRGDAPAPELEAYLLAYGMSDPAILGQVLKELGDEDFKSPVHRALAVYLSTIGALDDSDRVAAEGDAPEPALLAKLDTVQKLRDRLPPLEGEGLLREMREIARRLRLERLRGEKRRIQSLLSEEEPVMETAELRQRQRNIHAEMRELQLNLRQLGAARAS